MHQKKQREAKKEKIQFICQIHQKRLGIPLWADTLSNRLLEHLEALHPCFSSTCGHCNPPLDSGLKTWRVRVEVPLPHATLHLDHSLHSLTWQSITVIRYAPVVLIGNGREMLEVWLRLLLYSIHWCDILIQPRDFRWANSSDPTSSLNAIVFIWKVMMILLGIPDPIDFWDKLP